MKACSTRVQEYHQKLKQIKIPKLFEDNILQEEYMRFLAVSSEIFHHKSQELVHIPKLLQSGWSIHFCQHHHNYHDVLDFIGLPENQAKFESKGENCLEFLSLYAESFGYPLNSQVYETNIHLREKAVA